MNSVNSQDSNVNKSSELELVKVIYKKDAFYPYEIQSNKYTLPYKIDNWLEFEDSLIWSRAVGFARVDYTNCSNDDIRLVKVNNMCSVSMRG